MDQAVDVGVLALGFHQALARFQGVDASDAEAAFLPMFEMLNWASAIDERCSRDFAPDGTDRMPGKDWEQRLTGHEVVRGVRFARNLVHHQWAEAVEWRPTGPGWFWRSAADLPRSRKKSGREGYESDLAGRLVVPTLLVLDETFASISRLLDSSASLAGMGRASRRALQLAPSGLERLAPGPPG